MSSNTLGLKHTGPGAIAAALLLLGGIAGLSPAATEAQARTRGARASTAQGQAEEAAPPGSPEGVVNIQTATAEQLDLLPGIGPSKAQAIVSFRERHAFRRVEDILRVRGIGRGTFRELRPMLTVDGPTTLTAQPRSARRAAPPDEAAEGAERD
jgi:competence protein ComEA